MNLYISPVGEYGILNFNKIINTFPKELFDFFVFSYDNSIKENNLFKKINVNPNEYKWQHIKRNYRQFVNKYDYIFYWDDDFDIKNFNVINYLDIIKRNKLDISQPSIEGYYTWGITLKKDCKVGRETNFVEIGCPVFSNDAFIKVIENIVDLSNGYGYYYDYLFKDYVEKLGIIDCETINHTRQITSNEKAIVELKEYLKIKNPIINMTQKTLWKLI